MSKKNTIYFAFSLLLLMVLVMPACNLFKKKTEEAAEVKQEIVQEPKFRLLDVNSAEVYSDAHIPGAINASFEGIEELSKGWNKKTPIVTYCSSYDCPESHRVAKKLRELGFEDVGVFAGGTNEWKFKGTVPLEGEAKRDFLEKEITAKAEPKAEDGVRIVTAADLGKMLEEAKAATPAPAAETAEKA